MMQKKQAATARPDRRNRDRRNAADRRSSMRLQTDRRRGFGRREEDIAEAAALEQTLSEALKEAETSGAEDTRVALTLNDLGVFYYLQGRYSEAEPLHKRALENQENALGSTHPDLVRTLFNLAALAYAQNNYADSEALLKRALTIVREVRLESTRG